MHGDVHQTEPVEENLGSFCDQDWTVCCTVKSVLTHVPVADDDDASKIFTRG